MNLFFNFFKVNFSGVLLVSFIVFIANIISPYTQVGSVALSIILGLVINALIPISKSFKQGVKFSEKHLLSFAIVLMGANLDLAILRLIETKVIVFIILIVLLTICFSIFIGKLFNFSSSLSILLGLGNGICGSSAIAGGASIIKSKDEDIGLSISIINILGALGIFIVPGCINVFYSGPVENQGVIIGSTIQAVGQVTAAGFMMGDTIGEVATITKMFRILMLGPILLCLSFFYARNINSDKKSTIFIQPFIAGFIIIVILVNYGLIPVNLLPMLKLISKYCLLCAMAAIGLNISLQSFINKGYKVFFASCIVFAFQIVFSIYLLS